jgi:hypothetical protein
MSHLQVVLDPVQLGRIQATHRGFLYQHLYAVGLLLSSTKIGLISLVVEKDEDIELILPTSRLYLQIKTRSRDLIPSDVADSLSRFDEIRAEHGRGTRGSTPRFCILTNASPSAALKAEIANWPTDVAFKSPSFGFGDTSFPPPAWSSLEETIEWCIRAAEQVPFGSLSAETLVWKLAGVVLFSCTGGGWKEFKVSELPALLEQMVVQLHSFPNLPNTYRPQADEPSFLSDERIVLIEGFSGAGKTTWAAHGSLHSPGPVAYFDIGDMPTSAVAPSLARELAALVLPGNHEEIRKLMLPGASGLQSLRALDLFLKRAGIKLTATLDNVHRMSSGQLVDILKVMPSVRFVLLAQPWPDLPTIETAAQVEAKKLRGWAIKQIAEEFAANGCDVSVVQAERLRRLTGGLPLYIQNLAKIVREYYASNADAFCDELETLTHAHATGQEAILRQIQIRLSPRSNKVSGLLAISDVPLQRSDVATFLQEGLSIEQGEVFSALRELQGWGIVEVLRDGRITLHDSFRILAQGAQSDAGAEAVVRAKKCLVRILQKEHGVPTFRLLCRLLPEIGAMEALVDIASGLGEYFHEFGMSQEFESILSEAAQSTTIPVSDRFWAVDTLVYWKLQNNQNAEAEEYLRQLEKLSSEFTSGERQLEAISLKRLLLAGRRRDLSAVKEAFREASSLSPSDSVFHRTLRYNYAVSLYLGQKYDEAAKLTMPLIQEYFEVLGLKPEDVTLKNPPEIFKKLKNTDSQQDDLKHLADSLDLHAMIMDKLGKYGQALARLHSFKFYAMANALGSAVRVGRDLVDELSERGDAIGARMFMESTVLQVFSEGQALDYFLPIHSQYAVVLAYCGEIEAARRTMKELETFVVATPEWQDEYRSRRRVVERIANGELSLPENPRPVLPAPAAKRAKIGRNEPCPCGSGQKYKKCCGH